MILTQAISRVVYFYRPHQKAPAFFRTVVCVVLAAVFASPQLAGATIVHMQTNAGGFNIELYDTDAPQTVTNFLNYVNRGDYGDSVIHRSVPRFIIQGGGYAKVNVFGADYLFEFPKDAPVQNEFSPSRSNVRGTIAMAKLPATDNFGNPIPGGGPDSATSEWFINLNDNSADLNNQNGGFTVFGRVLSPGMDVVDAIASLPIQPSYLQVLNKGSQYFGDLPLIYGNLVLTNQICVNQDGDGACPETEDLAPGGDGNGDSIPDRDQANVTTIQTFLGGTATFAADAVMTLNMVDAVNSVTAVSQLTTFKSPPGQSVHFNNGMFTLNMTGAMTSVGRAVTFYDGATKRPTHYYSYGKTRDNQTDHWYDFTFDGVTGAEIGSGRITLHFVDGERGDDDLTVNGSVTHTGAQAVVTTTDSSSAQSGGCSITTTPSGMSRGGDWVMVSLFLAMLALVRRRACRQRF